jgi:hypothetical protein
MLYGENLRVPGIILWPINTSWERHYMSRDTQFGAEVD